MMFRKSLAVGLVLLMVVSGFAGLIGGTGESNASDAGHLTPVVQAYSTHAPIRINSNADFTIQASSEGWNGSGTEGDPYIIENYDINGTNYGYCIYIGNTTVHFVVRNCSLHNASGNPGIYYWDSGLYLYNVGDGILENNTVSNNWEGIYLDSSSNNIIINNTASSNYDYGISLDFSSNNTVTNNTASNNNGGIHLYSSSSNTIANNTALNNWDGISLDSSSSNTIANNTASNNSGGIHLYSSTNNTITNNTASSNYDYGISLDFASNNTVTNNTASNNNGGIHLYSSTNNTIQNNTASSNNDGSGIFLDSSDSNTIANNNASSNGWYGIYDYGIYLYSSSSNTITNNTASSNTGDGIYLYSSSSNTIANNRASLNNYYGIFLESSSNNNITSNNIISNKIGIYINSAINNTLYNNTISNNTNHGLYFDSSSSNSIISNSITSNQQHGIVLIDSSRSNSIISNNILSNGYYGISLYPKSNNTTIRLNSILFNQNYGIWMNFSYNNTISENNISRNSYGTYLTSSSNNTLYNNTISNNSNYGFGLYSSSNNTIANNIANSNNHYGIRLAFSNSNTIANNIANSNNWEGILLYSSSNNTIINNNASNNDGSIFLSSSSNNAIANNTASNNNYGIFLSSSNNNTITNNTASSNNNDGIRLYYADNNTIYHNNFLNNTNQAYDNTGTNRWNASYATGGNYWSDYSGTDIYSGPAQNISGQDGIGDAPYTNIDGGSGAHDSYPLMHPMWYPSIEIISPSYGAIFNVSNVTVSWEGSDDSGINHYEIQIDGGSWTNVGLDTSYNFTGLSDDSHTVDVKAVDNASNENKDSVTFTVDIAAPKVTIDSPSDGTIFNTTTVTVSWSGSDATSGIDHYEVRNDSSTWIDVGLNTSYNFTELSAGSHTVDVKAVDNASNENTTSVTFTVDATAPEVTIDSPSDGTIFNTNSVTVSWTGSDVTTGIDHYEVRNDSGSWINVGTDTSHDFTGLSDSSHTVDVKAIDNATNEATDSVTFTTDTTNPTVSITSPSDGTIFNTNSVTVSWTGSDATSGISHYEIRIDGGLWISVGTDRSYPFTNLSDGSHTVDLKAVDNATNEATDSVTFTTDTTNPTVSITSPSDDTTLNTSSVTVSWTGSDATSGIDHYNYRIDSGAWSANTTITSNTFSALSEGSHTAEVMATDGAGNTNTTTVTFTIDTTAPTITQHSPIGQNVSVNSTINVTFSEPMNRASVQITVSGLNGTISWNGSTAVFTPAANLNAGTTYFVNVTGADTAGNPLARYMWNFSTAEIINPPAESTTGNISGVVLDENGSPVAGATVTVQGTNITAITNSTGHFLLENVSAGPHNLTISREGFNNTVASVTVTEGETATVNPVLHPMASQPAKGPSMLWWIILVVAAVLIVAALLMRKKGGKEPLSFVYEETANQGPEDAGMEEPEEITKPAEPEAPSSSPPPAPENTQAQKPKFSREQMVSNIEKAYREGKMSEEMYRRNMEKFGRM